MKLPRIIFATLLMFGAVCLNAQTVAYTVAPTPCGVSSLPIFCDDPYTGTGIPLSLYDPATKTYTPEGAMSVYLDYTYGATNWIGFSGGLSDLNDPTTGLVLVDPRYIVPVFGSFTSNGKTGTFMNFLTVYYWGTKQDGVTKFAGETTLHFNYAWACSRGCRWFQSITAGATRITTTN